jgi:hypothetical protein
MVRGGTCWQESSLATPILPRCILSEQRAHKRVLTGEAVEGTRRPCVRCSQLLMKQTGSQLLLSQSHLPPQSRRSKVVAAAARLGLAVRRAVRRTGRLSLCAPGAWWWLLPSHAAASRDAPPSQLLLPPLLPA